ncbi:MAG TPA: hypothetical protein DD729_08965 [Rhodobacteraceae bacterium]|nr:hypothetical protein [Paracoccaceae bacterium]
MCWQTDRLYFANPPVLTSAGVASGIDLALAIVRMDCGVAAALEIAREMVVYLHRAGGQSQFADTLAAQYCQDGQLQKLMDQLFNNPQNPWTLESMADYLGLTPRTLSRRFVKETGCSPVQFLERLRVKRASDAIAAGASIAKAMGLTGFKDFQQMQRAFKRQLNVTVGEFSNRFQAALPDQTS